MVDRSRNNHRGIVLKMSEGQFCELADPQYVTETELVQQGRSIPSIRWALGMPDRASVRVTRNGALRYEALYDRERVQRFDDQFLTSSRRSPNPKSRPTARRVIRRKSDGQQKRGSRVLPSG
jgi:hypothetical protein